MTTETLFFGPFRLDLAERTLWRHEARVPVRPKTYTVLSFLVQNAGRLVTADELLENIWRDVAVDEELLRGYIHELRALLGDSAAEPIYIEAVARRGYRFLADVTTEGTFLPPVARDDGEPLVPDAPASGPARRDPIVVGVLHSLSGLLAWTETPVVDATMLAIREINERGGIRGRMIEPIVVDGKSSEAVFARKAAKLIDERGAAVLFGCWTSACRKAVVPIVEERNSLLFYPVQYEGLEASPNVVYTGAVPNQQIIPGVRWAFDILSARRFFLVGWNAIYSWAAHEIIRDEIAAAGGEIVGEAYLDLDGVNVHEVVREIAAAQPDFIVNSTVGDLNLLYTRMLRGSGVSSDKVPSLYLSVGEAELLSHSTGDAVGDYAVWNYFQSIERPENRAFVDRFRGRYGPRRVTNDPMEAAYVAVNLWARAAEAAGPDNVADLRAALPGPVYEAPDGPVRVDSETQHIWKTARVGQFRSDNQFSILWSSEQPIRPEPFPSTRPRDAWARLLAERYAQWGGHWTAPVPAR
jgi:urea transport system substrate-binding protein